MHDVFKAVVPQTTFDLVRDKQTQKRFAQFPSYRLERASDLARKVIERTARLVVGEHDLTARRALRDSPQRGLDGIKGQIHGDTDPGTRTRQVR
jgi:hypothetical protein